MIRVFLFLLAVTVLAAAAVWLAEHPGDVALTWQGWHVETSVAVFLVAVLALVLVAMALWTVLRLILGGPTALAGYFRSRRREKGLRALSQGMIAAGAGDQKLARRYASDARKLMAGEPLTLLLQAQAAQLSGDRKGARQAFEKMLENPDTELLGLRGLYIEAQRAGDDHTARRFAERVAEQAPGVAWAANALLELETREGDWEGALRRIERNADHRLLDRKQAKRARAVLLTAEAIEREESDPDGALERALEAHRLAPELVPAAAVAGRLLAAESNTRQATRILEKTWRLAPHPELAGIYLHARPGDSARDRLKRARSLAGKLPSEPEGRIAVAMAAIETRDWTLARETLAPLLRDGPTRRLCLLMAEIEDGEHGDAGRAREWLARALRAPRDKAWVADGFVSARWAPVSPVTGRLDAFEWTTPPDALAADGPAIDDSLPEDGPRPEPGPVIEAEDAAAEPAEPVPAAAEPAPPKTAGDAGAADRDEAPEPPEDRPGAQRNARDGGGRRTEAAAPAAGAAAIAADAEREPAGPEAAPIPRPPDDPGPEPDPEEPGPAPRSYM